MTHWFSQLSIGSKLGLGFGALALSLVATGGLAYHSLSLVDEDLEHISRLAHEETEFGRLEVVVLEMVRAEKEHLCSGDPQAVQHFEEHLTEANELFDGLAMVVQSTDDPQAQRTFDEAHEHFNEFLAVHARVEAMIEAGQLDPAIELSLSEGSEGAERVLAGIVSMIEDAEERASLDREEAHESVRAAVMEMALIVGVALALAIVVGVTITRAITRPVASAVEVLGEVAQGNFTRRMSVSSRDEIGQIATAINTAVERVSQTLVEVRESAEQVAMASRELSAASGHISAGAQESASSLEQTAASLEQITSTVQNNADNAQEAANVAKTASELARVGGEVTANANGAMKGINEASRRIADIIGTIDEIAFQTNLLALNAAVEAARAGEEGRGFAVVASEVRNLAQRSAEAAREIKGLIEDSVQRVERGSALVEDSGRKLGEIVQAIGRTSEIVAAIAQASREQSTGIEQLNQAVTQLDQVTQSNASQTEELSATADGLSGQAGQLKDIVSRFQISGAPSPSMAPAPTRPSATRANAPKSPLPQRKAQATAGSNAAASVEQGQEVGAHARGESFEEF
ncbi:MAG: HAMP domain-containing protein [Planctomycetes bacterium]|nr:HAMP domain-containing protein [Planctomycetota bacterium]